MEPTSAEIVEVMLDKSVTAICTWAGFDELGTKEYFDMLDFEVNPSTKPRLLAMLSKEQHQKLMEEWMINDKKAKPAVVMMATLVHKTARFVCGAKDAEPIPVPPPTMPPPTQVITNGGRTIKASSIIDPADESTIPGATSLQLKVWYANYKELKFGDPLPEKEPTPDQICAMHMKIVQLGLEPYADFSLLTPHGRRMQKVLRHRSWIPQRDGTYQAVDVPGPECWETWRACWSVYEVILLMLRWPATDDNAEEDLVVSPIALEAYLQNFEVLVKENPGCWRLCQTAEDRCRAEEFPRIARRLTESIGYAPSWSQVFIAAAESDRYWDKEVRRPALRFLASGARSNKNISDTHVKDNNPKAIEYVHSDMSGKGRNR